MEKIISNAGLQYLSEKVFWNLDVDILKICSQINQSCKQMLENPIFWLKNFRSLSKKNQKDWIKVIKDVKNSDKIKAIISYLQWNLKKVVDLPCFSNPRIQDEFRRKIMKCCSGSWKKRHSTEMVQLLAPLTDNPNAPDEGGDPNSFSSMEWVYKNC